MGWSMQLHETCWFIYALLLLFARMVDISICWIRQKDQRNQTTFTEMSKKVLVVFRPNSMYKQESFCALYTVCRP